MSDKDEIVEEKQRVSVVKAMPPWRLITVGVFATVVVVAVMIAGWMFILLHHQARPGMMNRFDGLSQSSTGPGGFMGRGGMRHGGGGGTIQQSAARGVVTAVNGDTITVSGEGKQVTVTKSSSTTISGDKTDVAVNDTVVVYGTTGSDGTVSATQILVHNLAPTSGAGANADDSFMTPGA
ncbi:MAG: hypothetical protein JWO07_355 [Candidatus Saccharibacteria bacterium]|nr:hypothetical protein [Candidatus Saccharibacteria bacterium]